MGDVIDFPNVEAQRSRDAFNEQLVRCCQRHLTRDEQMVVVNATDHVREMARAFNASVDTLRWVGRTGWSTEAELAEWTLMVARSVFAALRGASC